MVKRWLILGVVGLVTLFPIVVDSQTTAAAIFLAITPGARPNGMAEIFTAIADDATATYYNDGGLGFFHSRELHLMHANWLPGLWHDMYYEFLAYVQSLDIGGVMGIHFIYLTTGETVGTDEEGNPIGRWRTFDAAMKVSYGVRLSPRLGVGVGFKFIYSFLAPSDIIFKITGRRGGGTGITWALDGGLLYKIRPNFNLGVALLNIGPGIKYIDIGSSDPIPRMLRVGVSYLWEKRDGDQVSYSIRVSGEIAKLLIGFYQDWQDIRSGKRTLREVLQYHYDDTWKGIGVEVGFAERFYARAGYFSDKAGHREGPTFGGGFRYKNFTLDVGVDNFIYDFKTENYRISLNYAF